MISFTVTVTDASGATLTKNFTITVNPPLAITSALPPATAGTTYDQTLTVSGGTTPYTTIAVSGFDASTTGLTAGAITINVAAGTITINGTPTGAGMISFTVTVTDTAGATLTKNFTIMVTAPLV
jgi:hypothetical protein